MNIDWEKWFVDTSSMTIDERWEVVKEKYWFVLEFWQTAYVSRFLIITSLLALFVYTKILFRPPFYGNNTFKLIVLGGMADLLSCHAYLFLNGLLSYPFMFDFYKSMKNSDIYNVLLAFEAFLNGVALHSDFFLALNRLRALISPNAKRVSLMYVENFWRVVTYCQTFMVVITLTITGIFACFGYRRLFTDPLFAGNNTMLNAERDD
ncbi:hypothetical protein PRIPAC_85428, partial [Pristionchus pacificus]|uniref:Uncharacterized protein n=1 Tax=Pristionchus pacificus TaxID=54126 RepID=A0A2A6BL33_PRIPA